MLLHRSRVLLCVLGLVIVNLVITANLFGVEYSAYRESIESTFIAIARVMAEHPGEWGWWPLWSGGMPFENSYLPLTHWTVAAFSVLTGLSPARSFHVVTAGVYALSASAVFWMALALSRRLATSFVAALAYSCISCSALLVPAIRLDAGGPLSLRRLQVLAYWGEAPHTVALALLPVAVVCFSRTLTTNAVKWKILAGVLAASIALSSAFGIVGLVTALLGWLLTFRSSPWWKAPLIVAAIGVVSYCWIAPWLSFGMIRAIRANSFTTGADYRYTAASWIALAILSGGYLLLWFLLRRARVAAHVQFFALFAYAPTAIVLTWYVWKVALIPQPGRYELEMDLALSLAVVFSGGAILDRLPRSARWAAVAVVITGLAFQVIYSVRYARDLIRSVEPAQLVEYRIAKWMDQNRPGERAYIAGSSSFLYNVFTDNPQLHGAHVQFGVNSLIPVVDFTIYSGMNAGARDAEYSVLWLKAYGAHAVFVAAPERSKIYRPFANPRKFEGVLPLLWREGDDAIYEVPSRSASLAHVIPAAAVVTRRPIHGLDIAPVEPYVAALDDASYPLATFQWRGMSQADIRATVERGQVIAVQITYDPGWEAYVTGRRQTIRGDALGLMVIEPDCIGPCEVSLRYTGGRERIVTRAMSLAAMLAAAAYGWFGRNRSETPLALRLSPDIHSPSSPIPGTENR
jgi:hypothetical protein